MAKKKKQTSKTNKQKQQKQTKSSQSDLIQNETRFQIWGLLSIFPELSFSQICKKLNKSKSTVHPHLHKLLELEIIEVVKEELVRGNIPAKFYGLTNNKQGNNMIMCGIGDYCPPIVTGDKDIGKINGQFSQIVDLKLAYDVIEGEKTIETYSKQIINSKLKFLDMINNPSSASQTIQDIFGSNESFNCIMFLNEKEYRKLRELFEKMLNDLNDFINNEESSETKNEKPFVFLASANNFKRIQNKILKS